MDITPEQADRIIAFLRSNRTQIADAELLEAIERADADQAYERLKLLKQERLDGKMTGDHFIAPILANAIHFMVAE